MCSKGEAKKSQKRGKQPDNLSNSDRDLTANPLQQIEYLINFLPDPTFAINLEGRVIAWNRAMEKLSGISAEEILGKGDYAYAIPYYGFRRPLLLDLILKQDKKIEKFYPVITRENETLITEVFTPGMKPSGKYMWVKASPLYDSQGCIAGAIEATRDITEIKRYQQKLEEMNEKLKAERVALSEKNIALKEILTHIEEEKQQVSDNFRANINRVIMPIIKNLRKRVNVTDREYFTLLERCLKDIASPFINKLELRVTKLSPRELEICNMVKNGLSSKEIAGSLNISIHTVVKQRQRIRKKLGINNQGVNLITHLQGI